MILLCYRELNVVRCQSKHSSIDKVSITITKVDNLISPPESLNLIKTKTKQNAQTDTDD